MRILLITNVFPNPFEPTKGTFNLHMVRALARRHEVRVVSPILWTDEWKARRQGKPPLDRSRRAVVHGIEAEYPVYYYTPKVLRPQYGNFYWWSVRGTVKRALAAEPPDVVLGYWVHPDGETAVRAARLAGVPAVIMAGGSDLLLLPENGRRRRCIVEVLREADAVVAVSRDLRDKFVELGVAPQKVHVVSRGVDKALFSLGDRSAARRRLGIPEAGPVLVWVGRMVPVKGLDVLLGACAFLRSKGANFRLYLVGDGALRGSLEGLTQARGLSDMVTFTGARPQDELPDWYRAADATVLPSHSEGVPNVLRESLACGTRFVASRVGGIPELAEEPENLLVPPGDPTALAEALARILAEAGPAAAGPTRSRSWGWDEAAEALERVIGPLVRSRQAPNCLREEVSCRP
jgi:teichuronic acid biosynthesis glycosyltransferase TuaC